MAMMPIIRNGSRVFSSELKSPPEEPVLPGQTGGKTEVLEAVVLKVDYNRVLTESVTSPLSFSMSWTVRSASESLNRIAPLRVTKSPGSTLNQV